MQFHRLLILKLVVVLSLLSITFPVTLAQHVKLPALIMANRTGFHPEGIAWDADNHRFLTSSLTEGTIFEVADDNTVTPFIEDKDLVATLGLHIDRENDRLLVANAELSDDPESKGLAQLGIY